MVIVCALLQMFMCIAGTMQICHLDVQQCHNKEVALCVYFLMTCEYYYYYLQVAKVVAEMAEARAEQQRLQQELLAAVREQRRLHEALDAAAAEVRKSSQYSCSPCFLRRSHPDQRTTVII